LDARDVNWLKHAFAIDPPGPAVPNPPQREVVERTCREIVSRGMTAPAILFLEMSRPLNFLGAQAIQFFMPIASAVADTRALGDFATFLEQRGSVDYIRDLLERLETGAGTSSLDHQADTNTHEDG
jgi:hypothetical protein